MQTRMMWWDSAVQHAQKRWRLCAVIVVILVATIIAWRSVHLGAIQLLNITTKPVLCLVAIQGQNSSPIVIYQRGTQTREEAMREQQLDSLIRDGFTVLDETCFETWQAAADYLTNDEVLLPEDATEDDCVLAVARWQRSNTR